MNIIGIIQARMGSTRLPGKVLKPLAGRPMLWHVLKRAQAARRVDETVLATTTRREDRALAVVAKDCGVSCFFGDENDVLDRYFEAAKLWQADVIVRITGDCPLLDPAVVDTVVVAYLAGNFDYVSNTIEPTYPDGLDTEVCSFSALERAWREAKLPSEREHVTPYIWKHPDLFKISNVKAQMPNANVDLSSHRWTLDTPEDLEFLRLVISACEANGNCSLDAVMGILREHPDWRAINAQYARNEGYAKSLREDEE